MSSTDPAVSATKTKVQISTPQQAAEHHKKAAHHLTEAAKNHLEAAKYQKQGNSEKAAEVTLHAQGHYTLAGESQREYLRYRALKK